MENGDFGDFMSPSLYAELREVFCEFHNDGLDSVTLRPRRLIETSSGYSRSSFTRSENVLVTFDPEVNKAVVVLVLKGNGKPDVDMRDSPEFEAVADFHKRLTAACERAAASSPQDEDLEP